jgi:hypothetical protein
LIGKDLSLHILTVNDGEYASYMGERFSEFQKIESSGYGYIWFAQCFYRYWLESKQYENLELWGNMGSHYTSNRTSQFSEVMVVPNDADTDEANYKSDVFILTLIGSKKSIRKEIAEIKKYINEKNKIKLPFKVFLIRFDRLRATDKDPSAVDPDLLFKNIEWIPSFKIEIYARPHQVSVGVIDESF